MDQRVALRGGLIEHGYDMLKAADRAMVMQDVHVLEKRGGKSGDWKSAP